MEDYDIYDYDDDDDDYEEIECKTTFYNEHIFSLIEVALNELKEDSLLILIKK